LGGAIYIHGEGDNNAEYTQGCIKLSNPDMQKLYEKVDVNMDVFIEI
jgi:lipoprotein-anchoring transpeptidase ErfK/SrfK